MSDQRLISTEQLQTPNRTSRRSRSSLLSLLGRDRSRGSSESRREEEGGSVRGGLDGVAQEVGESELSSLGVCVSKEGNCCSELKVSFSSSEFGLRGKESCTDRVPKVGRVRT